MLLAHQAGWPATAMIRFYEKLAGATAPAFFDWEYPPAAERVKMARILSIEFRGDH